MKCSMATLQTGVTLFGRACFCARGCVCAQDMGVAFLAGREEPGLDAFGAAKALSGDLIFAGQVWLLTDLIPYTRSP